MQNVLYVLDPLPDHPERLIYLAGPMPRDMSDPGWHPDAIDALRSAGYEGRIVLPRTRSDYVVDSGDQVRWEHRAMARANALLFWIPRVLWTLPGLTTNLEWGVWHNSGKAVLAAPPDAPRMRYLRYYADLAGAPQADSLAAAARIAVSVAARTPVTAGTPEGQD